MTITEKDMEDVLRIAEEHLSGKIKKQESGLKEIKEKGERIKVILDIVVSALKDSGNAELAKVIRSTVEKEL